MLWWRVVLRSDGSDGAVDAMLSRTLSSGWTKSYTRVFSVLAAASGPGGHVPGSGGGGAPATSASGGGAGEAGGAGDDVEPVNAQFERFLNDVLQHL